MLATPWVPSNAEADRAAAATDFDLSRVDPAYLAQHDTTAGLVWVWRPPATLAATAASGAEADSEPAKAASAASPESQAQKAAVSASASVSFGTLTPLSAICTRVYEGQEHTVLLQSVRGVNPKFVAWQRAMAMVEAAAPAWRSSKEGKFAQDYFSQCNAPPETAVVLWERWLAPVEADCSRSHEAAQLHHALSEWAIWQYLKRAHDALDSLKRDRDDAAERDLRRIKGLHFDSDLSLSCNQGEEMKHSDGAAEVGAQIHTTEATTASSFAPGPPSPRHRCEADLIPSLCVIGPRPEQTLTHAARKHVLTFLDQRAHAQLNGASCAWYNAALRPVEELLAEARRTRTDRAQLSCDWAATQKLVEEAEQKLLHLLSEYKLNPASVSALGFQERSLSGTAVSDRIAELSGQHVSLRSPPPVVCAPLRPRLASVVELTSLPAWSAEEEARTLVWIEHQKHFYSVLQVPHQHPKSSQPDGKLTTDEWIEFEQEAQSHTPAVVPVAKAKRNSNDAADAFPASFATPFSQVYEHGAREARNVRPAILLRELTMNRIAAEWRAKPNFHLKASDPQIRQRWLLEAHMQAPELSLHALIYMMQETCWWAEQKAAALQANQPFLCSAGIDGVWQSDDAVSAELLSEMLAAMRPLEQVPESERDYHPGSDRQVVNLVHPSNYCLRAAPNKIDPQEEKVDQEERKDDQAAVGAVLLQSLQEAASWTTVVPFPRAALFQLGEVCKAAFEVKDRWNHRWGESPPEDRALRYSWLPAEFAVAEDGHVTVESYINNLHPERHSKLYDLIASTFECVLPLLERTLTQLHRPPPPRITQRQYWTVAQPRPDPMETRLLFHRWQQQERELRRNSEPPVAPPSPLRKELLQHYAPLLDRLELLPIHYYQRHHLVWFVYRVGWECGIHRWLTVEEDALRTLGLLQNALAFLILHEFIGEGDASTEAEKHARRVWMTEELQKEDSNHESESDAEPVDHLRLGPLLPSTLQSKLPSLLARVRGANFEAARRGSISRNVRELSSGWSRAFHRSLDSGGAVATGVRNAQADQLPQMMVHALEAIVRQFMFELVRPALLQIAAAQPKQIPGLTLQSLEASFQADEELRLLHAVITQTSAAHQARSIRAAASDAPDLHRITYGGVDALEHPDHNLALGRQIYPEELELQHPDVQSTFDPRTPSFDQLPPPQRLSLRGRSLQVIVKLANIELTPASPRYPGGSWHVEGEEHEAIVASAIVYLSSDNITESRLAFRHACHDNNAVSYQDDSRSGLELYGLQRDQALSQLLGSVRTQGGRVIAFPNIFQHQVQPFELADPTSPGRRRILVFFLVDPSRRIPSTASVPPQRRDWWLEHQQQRHCEVMLHTPLIDPLVNIIDHYESAEWQERSMTREESDRHRIELMKRRKFAVDQNTEEVYEREYSFCEH